MWGYLKFLFIVILHAIQDRQKETIESNHQFVIINDRGKNLQSLGPANSTDQKKKTSSRELTTENRGLEEAEEIYRRLKSLTRGEKRDDLSSRTEQLRRKWTLKDVEHSEAAGASYHNATSAPNCTSNASNEMIQTAFQQSSPINNRVINLLRIEPYQAQVTYSQDAQTKFNTTILGNMTDHN
uniref:Uncharacterized protein n=1 Tax=Parascaris univalens TaxID=6257 RepID=A0A915BCT3_PARUN